jgi:UDP-N-acetylmuramate--alanine ligase
MLVPGNHNRMNASTVLALAKYLNLNIDEAKKSLSKFSGTWRRLEKIAEKNGVIIYDDYAHHPTEVKASLSALRELYPKDQNRIIVIFQPHLYSRTKALFNEFIDAFDEADIVVLLPIYFAREDKDPSISSILLAEEIKKHKNEVFGFDTFSETLDFVRDLELKSGDIFITMGAGEAYKIANDLFELK